MSEGVRRIESRSVVEQVTEELRRCIISGTLAPGEEFSLRGVASMLGVSFIPVREALRTLTNESLVTTRPGRSAMVAPLDMDDLAAIYRLRLILEPEIAERSCLVLEDGELDRLEGVSHQFGLPDANIDDTYDAHHAFHLDLLAPCATTWDLRTLETLWHAAERYIRIAFGRLDPDPAEHARREQSHIVLVQAFRSRDPELVKREVTRHLKNNQKIAELALSELPDSELALTATP